MKNNKYFIFISIGFELVSILLVAIWFGDWLQKKGIAGAQAFAVVVGFILWFVSLLLKLKKIEK